MNTWVVGNMPTGHHVYNYSKPIWDIEQLMNFTGEKIFFVKARMMAGQANLKDNAFGIQDFRWLDRDEVQRTLPARNWTGVKNILPER